MRIGIDARMADWGGVGRYTCNLLKALSLIDNKNEYILLCNKDNAHLLPEAPNFTKKFVNLSVFSLVNQFSWSPVFKAEKPDVFHAPHFMIPATVDCPVVVTIHDLIPLLFPEDIPSPIARKYYKTFVLRGIKKAQKIIAVSNSTKNDLIKMTGTVPDKINVIYEAASEKFKPISDKKILEQVKEKYEVKNKFILCVTNFKPHKNIITLIEAFRLIIEKFGDVYDLVLVGREDIRFPQARNLSKKYGLEKNVIFTGFISDDDLALLYNGAEVFVFISLYEGFGLPLLEAMTCGAPSVCSNISSLPELADETSYMVDPHKPEEVFSVLSEILINSDLRNELSRKELIVAQKFSWQKTAEQTLEIYESLQKVH
ncbi:MAG: glycosyltransferase family 4 protein [Actinobacteria bacterium]|nr:glycosyltransferase family 4 protein [Actinomycetota bacterium]